jgi:putative oxygen-independent coproporphyrinogen III oxidase
VTPATRPQRAAPPVGLYVHVPFCVSLCPYCDFVVYAGAAARGGRSRVAAFVRALHAEIQLRADGLDARFGPPGAGRPPLASVYLGGGTPSLLPADEVAALLDHVRARFGLADRAEVTLEANPGPQERGDAAALARAGVTRVSLGAQRLDEGELRRLGRRHRPEDVADAVAGAREAGIRSVSLDLLYDVPGDSPPAWAATLDRALALRPDHLSLYALTLDDPDAEGLTGPRGDHLPTTAGARRWRDRARVAQDEDRAADAYVAAATRLAGAGFRGYEISNWARPGHESRHNLAYWERRPVEAVGPGAHAFDGVERRWNAARLDGYLAALGPPDGSPPGLPPGGAEILDGAAARAEAVILALRTDRGVPAAAMTRPPLRRVHGWAVEQGLLEATPDARIVLTIRGRLLSNEVFGRIV